MDYAAAIALGQASKTAWDAGDMATADARMADLQALADPLGWGVTRDGSGILQLTHDGASEVML
jgi:hypothetical protein